jgi:UDP-N-acetylglucosamine 2-epimerase (non-hydrolysing)
MKHIVIVLGTRPEAIKLLPVFLELRKKRGVKTTLVSTGQHLELVTDVFQTFECRPDISLDVMRPDQTLAGLTARVLSGLEAIFPEDADVVIAQGDTTSAFVCSLLAFYRGIPCAHVEAGLRSGDMFAPFPEEFNRRAVSLTAHWHFAPTSAAAANLQSENVSGQIHVVGNTSIDAALTISSKGLPPSKSLATAVPELTASKVNVVLITAHRRENFGEGMYAIISAIRQLATRHQDLLFVWPVHPNPNVHDIVYRELAGLQNVRLLEPLGYNDMLYVLRRAVVSLSDSGGVQEEAPSFACPVLVLRENTERPEAIAAGCNVMVGTETTKIIETFEQIVCDPTLHRQMTGVANPYGDGTTSKQIVEILLAENGSSHKNKTL